MSFEMEHARTYTSVLFRPNVWSKTGLTVIQILWCWACQINDESVIFYQNNKYALRFTYTEKVFLIVCLLRELMLSALQTNVGLCVARKFTIRRRVVYAARYPPLSAARWSTLAQVLSLVLPLQHLLPESDTYSVERTSALAKCYACSTLFFSVWCH